MNTSSTIVALFGLLMASTPANAEPRVAELCGPGHVNEMASETDVTANPAGFFVASLREQLSSRDPRIILSPVDGFYLCTRSAATPDMDTSKALLLMRERTVRYLFVPIVRQGNGSSS
jgi:hypothetical protein